MACDMLEPCKFPSLDGGQKKEFDLAPHLVVSLVLHVGDMEKLPHAIGFESLNPFFRVSKKVPCFTAVEDGGDKRLVVLEFARKADDVAPPDPV